MNELKTILAADSVFINKNTKMHSEKSFQSGKIFFFFYSHLLLLILFLCWCRCLQKNNSCRQKWISGFFITFTFYQPQKRMSHMSSSSLIKIEAIKLRELTTPRLSHNLIKTNFEVWASSCIFKTKIQQEASNLNKKIQFRMTQTSFFCFFSHLKN